MSPDPRTLPIETLLADAGWVRALARRLVRDPSAADDLAQDALVAAWRNPPRADANPRSWLARVVRNLLRQRRRSENAREQREQLRARPGAHDDGVLERAELAQRLAQHVLALEEPYRTTVLQRFFDGRSAEEIAERMGVPSSTVRTRLERALARLRERLEREHGREWLAALLPLAQGTSASGTAAGILGGIVMGTGTKLALGACAAALAGWILWPVALPSAALPVQERDPALPARLALAPTPTDESPTQRHAAAPAPEADSAGNPGSVAARATAPGTIEGRVLRRAAGAEQALAGAQLTLLGDYDPRLLPPEDAQGLAHARSGTDGGFRFEQLAAGRYVLRARSGASLRELELELRQAAPGAHVELVFGRGRIRGLLRAEGGPPLEGVVLRLGRAEFPRPRSSGSKPAPTPTDAGALRSMCLSDATGRFAFDELPAGSYWLNCAGQQGFWRLDWPGRMDRVELADGDEIELELGPPTGPVRWRGALRTASGALATGGATLHLERDESSRAGSSVHTYVQQRLQPDGRFDFSIEPARWKVALSLASHPDTRRECGEIEVPPDGLEQDLCVPGARLCGRVLDAATHEPLAGYAGSLRLGLRRPGEEHPGALHEAVLDEGSGYSIDMLDEGEWILTSFPIEVDAPEGRLELRIPPGAIEHRLDVEVRSR